MFSILYLSGIWSVVAVVGFGSTLHCTETEELAFICEQAMWLDKFTTSPFEYVISLLTSPFFHNGLEHILYVTIIGFAIIVQSFEVNYGSRAAGIMFFGMIALTYTYAAIYNNLIQAMWPDVDPIVYAFNRNWMGGSVGFFGIFGALLHKSSKPRVGLLIIVGFELLTHLVLGIRWQINLTHLSAALYGFLIWGYWLRYNENRVEIVKGKAENQIAAPGEP